MLKRSRSRRSKTRKLQVSLLGGLLLAVLAVIGIKFFGNDVATKVAVADTQETSLSSKQSTSVVQAEINLLSAKVEPSVSAPSEPSSEAPVTEEVSPEAIVEPVVAEEQIVAHETVVEPLVAAAPVVEYAPAYEAAPTAYPTVLANGNTAGAIGTEAAARMAAATGVPQATWEYIIARESNGNPNVANASGASGLFQTMPGWGSTATVDDQINAALNAYNNQGLAAWGMP